MAPGDVKDTRTRILDVAERLVQQHAALDAIEQGDTDGLAGAQTKPRLRDVAGGAT